MENSKPIIGLIAEFNPFHNGHIYLIKKIKEQFPDCFLIVALTSDVTQRGELTVASFEDRKNIALSYGVNKVVQLSDYETVQAAHIFVANAINLLLKENISHLVFGVSDKIADINVYLNSANAILKNNQKYNKLVKQNLNDEPASKLIKDIYKEKQKLIFEDKLKKNKNESFIYKNSSDNLYYEKIGEKITCIQKEIPFEIPNNWEWVRLGSVSFISFGYAFNSKEFNAFNGVRVIRISDFNSKGFINKNIVRYNANNETYDKYKVIENSILICMTGGTVGKSLYVDKLLEKMLLNQRIAMIYTNSIEIRYVDVTINSDYIQKVISKKKNSTNDNISAKDVNNFLIPLPPLNEQKRIINKIDSLLQKTKFLNFKN